jgi:hypothetical protein
MARPHIEPFCDRDVSFKNMNLSGFGRGMKYKMLSLDGDSGACSMTVQFDAGYQQAPGFSWSEWEMIVIEGELNLGDRVVRKGHYFYAPAGYSIPAMSSPDGALVLMMYNTGEPSHVASDEHHALAKTDLYHDVDSYMDIPWAMGNLVSPSVATGCLIKLLNYNPVSYAMTFLYCMTPAFYQDNISYHDCAEESYHLWGTSWMMQFGSVPTGGYFWRPAYINHGSFASEQGCIALGRVDSKLFNHFHYNPWTTPVENQDRSIARVHQRDPLLYRWMVSQAHNHPHGPEDFEDSMVRADQPAVSDGRAHSHWHSHTHHDDQDEGEHSHDGHSHSHD